MKNLTNAIILLFILICSADIHAQSEILAAPHPAYNFLERMDGRGIITDYDNFHIPKTRRTVAGYIKAVIEKKGSLSSIDKEILADLEAEFEYELYGTLTRSQSLIGGKYGLLSDKERFIYYYNDSTTGRIFFNLYGAGKYTGYFEGAYANNAFLAIEAGGFRGTVLDNWGFNIYADNGNVFGNKAVALRNNELKFNYKLTENSEETFFDQTEGSISADFDNIKFRIARERPYIGYGVMKPVIDANAPRFDYLGFNVNLDIFNYNFFHGKLLGNVSWAEDTVTGGVRVIEDKYISYHRLGLFLTDNVYFGAGEMVIYANRSFDLGYLNPFIFFKTAEHNNRDRDNALLFFDLKVKPVDGITLNGMFLMDDIDYGKLGSDWYGNKFLSNAGISVYDMLGYAPVDLHLEYIRLSPYVFTHRLNSLNYTSYGYPLNTGLQPNSDAVSIKTDIRLTNRLNFSAEYRYMRHGANPVKPDGEIINVGGDIQLGHRSFDSEESVFLDGDLEIFRTLMLNAGYEPVRGIHLDFYMQHQLNTLQNSITIDNWLFYVNLLVKI